MSSWLSISLPNPFKSDDQDLSAPPQNYTPPSDDHSPTGGVKEDLSVLGQTIGRQLRGVAAFLAPPPQSPRPPIPPESDPAAESPSQTLLGIRNDLVEIGGSLKSSLSLLSSNKAVSGISRLASNLLQFDSQGNEVEEDEDGGDDDDDGYSDDASEVAGVTEEVLDFVQEISFRPECWNDFPLSLDNDFDMSNAQKEHASAIEQLVPSLAVLRSKTCSNFGEENFWMIYFILLLPRLHEHDAKLLSTPKILETRELLLQKLRNKRNAPVETSEDSQTTLSSQEGGNAEGEANPSQEKEVFAGLINTEQEVKDDHESTDEWLQEDGVDASTSGNVQKQLENEEDVLFSDLEDDDSDLSCRHSRLRTPSPNGSSEWVQLSGSSGTQGTVQKAGSTNRGKDSDGEDSSGWLNVEEVDSDSLAAA